MQYDFFVFSFRLIESSSLQHTFTMSWSSATEGAIKIKSSAYINEPYEIPFILQPYMDNFESILSTYIQNNVGESTPPWRTPQDILNSSDLAEPHLTLEDSLEYQFIKTCMTHKAQIIVTIYKTDNYGLDDQKPLKYQDSIY